jgi:hypothetical protein
MTCLSGRQFYIQEKAFEFLASQSHQSAQKTYTLVAKTSFLRILRHHIEDGRTLKTIDLKICDFLHQHLYQEWMNDINQCLKKIHWLKIKNGNHNPEIHPILNPEETIANTCYFENYYTFATTEPAATRMFQAKETIREERLLQKNKNNETIHLIHGHTLAWIDMQKTKKSPKLISTSLEKEKESVLNHVRKNLDIVLKQINTHPDSPEAKFKTTLQNSLTLLFKHGILKIENLINTNDQSSRINCTCNS